MRSYRSSPAITMEAAKTIGDALDRAPRPYTAQELAAITGLPLAAVVAFLKRNVRIRLVSSHRISRSALGSSSGKPTAEYWRGSGSISVTFGGMHAISQKDAKNMEHGQRPIAWRDGPSTWSIDETDMVCVRQGSSLVRVGTAEGITAQESKLDIRIRGGTALSFETEAGQ